MASWVSALFRPLSSHMQLLCGTGWVKCGKTWNMSTQSGMSCSQTIYVSWTFGKKPPPYPCVWWHTPPLNVHSRGTVGCSVCLVNREGIDSFHWKACAHTQNHTRNLQNSLVLFSFYHVRRYITRMSCTWKRKKKKLIHCPFLGRDPSTCWKIPHIWHTYTLMLHSHSSFQQYTAFFFHCTDHDPVVRLDLAPGCAPHGPSLVSVKIKNLVQRLGL